ncbi:MAG: TonB-dependent receptor [Bacteroidetes bacterium]|nr:MAG: TonB-dependent receptor [Bacteroidota bacterium]
MRFLAGLAVFILFTISSESQVVSKTNEGIIAGNLLDSTTQKSIAGANVQLIHLGDGKTLSQVSTKEGEFSFTGLVFGYYRLSISTVGYGPMSFDSINVRTERFDFNLADIRLSTKSGELETVVVYAEKPLIQSKDGNITFNAGESALAAGSNASELLTSVPLVTKDPNGKILVRGKEPKILIDDKPVELNQQQLQDLLESLPGSSVEKIEVMTNPPPQYANEQGGVINIVTRKGRVGMGGRINISAGSRGERTLSTNFNYRKNKFAINVNAGFGYNYFSGNGYSERTNIYTDSTNFFNTASKNVNKSTRPNIRVNMDYDINKFNSLNLEATYNQNDFNNLSITEYTNINQYKEIYKLSERAIRSEGNNNNPALNFTYTHKGKKLGEVLKIITGANLSLSNSDRLFYQQYFYPDHTPNGLDSTQKQINDNTNNGHSVRVSYDKPLNKKTYLSVGAAYIRNTSNIDVDASYKKKPEGYFVPMELLSNNFKFYQTIKNVRASFRQVLGEKFSITAGAALEETKFHFDLYKLATEAGNSYWNLMPFANLNKNWNDNLSLTLSYRRTIRRPGINELNPTIDFSDPYNIRYGNPTLLPSLAHNFDLVIGRTKPKYFLNFGLGYNKVEDIFSQIRTLMEDGKTQITWENISHRNEYEASTWNGYTISKKLRLNLSASYTYNQYSDFDKAVRKYRDGGSFTTTVNGNYSLKDIWIFTGNFTTSRFANPQGSVNWNLSMNLSLQKKFFNKKLVVTLNCIDPFRNQQTNSYTYGKNFEVHSYNATQTKNYRLSLGYSFTKKAKKKTVKK